MRDALFNLTQDVDAEGWREEMFSGDKINMTKNRPVLHVALPNRSSRPTQVDGVDGGDVSTLVEAELQNMKSFVDSVRSEEWTG